MQDPSSKPLDLDSHFTGNYLNDRSALSADLPTRRIAAYCQKDDRLRYFNFVNKFNASARKVRHCINQITKVKVLQMVGVADLLANGNEGFAFVKMRIGSMLEQYGYQFCRAHGSVVNNQVYDGMRVSPVHTAWQKLILPEQSVERFRVETNSGASKMNWFFGRFEQ